jgi:hypothetical protein
MPASPSGFTVTHVSAQTYQVAGTYSPAATVRLWQNGFYIKDALCDTSGNFSTTITLDPGRRKVYLTGSVSGSTNESASSEVVTEQEKQLHRLLFYLKLLTVKNL